MSDKSDLKRSFFGHKMSLRGSKSKSSLTDGEGEQAFFLVVPWTPLATVHLTRLSRRLCTFLAHWCAAEQLG